MASTFLKSKLHHGTITHTELLYDGSVEIDENILEVSGMREYEQIDIYNANNGERWTTYIIKGRAGSGMISVNGPGARLAAVGDFVVMCTYETFFDNDIPKHVPTQVYLDERNNIIKKS